MSRLLELEEDEMSIGLILGEMDEADGSNEVDELIDIGEPTGDFGYPELTIWSQDSTSF